MNDDLDFTESLLEYELEQREQDEERELEIEREREQEEYEAEQAKMARINKLLDPEPSDWLWEHETEIQQEVHMQLAMQSLKAYFPEAYIQSDSRNQLSLEGFSVTIYSNINNKYARVTFTYNGETSELFHYNPWIKAALPVLALFQGTGYELLRDENDEIIRRLEFTNHINLLDYYYLGLMAGIDWSCPDNKVPDADTPDTELLEKLFVLLWSKITKLDRMMLYGDLELYRESCDV